MMAATELDPLFLKALKLLHSRSKDAASQLKQMYYDVVAKKRSNWNGKKIDDEENTRSSKHSGKRAEDLEAKKKEAEKRKLEKLKQELDDLSQDSLHPKKPKLDSSGSEKESKDRHKHDRKKELQEREKTTDSDSDSEESWIKEKERELAEREKEESGHSFGGFNSSESDSGSDTDVPDPEDHGLDLMDITCVVCQTFDVSSGNQLVECQDCHSLYHQECHRPTVSDKEVQDPRCVWYCSKCSKNMKKMVSSKNQKLKSGSSSVSSSGKESTASGKSTSKPEASAAPFKRTEITKTSSIGGKESSSSSSTSTSKQVPFAALSTLVALSSKDSAKQKPVEASSKQKSTSGLDPNKPGSFLFADPIRIKSTSSSSSKSGEGKVSLSASAKAEAAQRSANKPIDNTKYIGLGKSSSGSTKSSSGSTMHKSSSSSAMMGQTSSSKALQRSVSSSVGSSASGSASGVSSGGGSSSSSSSVNAEKRLQMMKKKANAKQIMKRTPIK